MLLVTNRLLTVIASNPATTSGLRTLNRAEKACSLLGLDSCAVGNLLDVPTYRTGNIAEVAASDERPGSDLATG